MWANVKETAREYPSHEKKENRARPLQTARQIFGQHGFIGFGRAILIYIGWVSLLDDMKKSLSKTIQNFIW